VTATDPSRSPIRSDPQAANPNAAKPQAADPRVDSPRVAEAHARSAHRLGRQRDLFRPLGWAVIVLVIAGCFDGHPRPGLHGKGLAVTLALVAFAAGVATALRQRFARRHHNFQATVIAITGAAGAALAGLQPRGATELAGATAVWMAVARLPLRAGLALGTLITIAIDVASAAAGGSSTSVLATTLLCALLGLMAHFMKQARESQERTEVLLAQLEDAREEQTRAAAIAERGRIAGELHDVLAHSLSGAAIQLQGARKLAERADATQDVRAAIDRASELVKDGLASARQAVGALRGERLPSLDELNALVDSFRADMQIPVTLQIEGRARPLPPDASLALYRGAQEALTNVARYAPGARTQVRLSYDAGHTRIIVENAEAAHEPLAGVGGGRGLNGMRERLERAGGSMQAGPTDAGWRVELEVPA